MNSYSTSWWSLLLIYRPCEDQRLSWPCWLTYSGRFTHINGYPSAAGPVQTSESSPVRDRRSTTEPPNNWRTVWLYVCLCVCLCVCLSVCLSHWTTVCITLITHHSFAADHNLLPRTLSTLTQLTSHTAVIAAETIQRTACTHRTAAKTYPLYSWHLTLWPRNVQVWCPPAATSNAYSALSYSTNQSITCRHAKCKLN